MLLRRPVVLVILVFASVATLVVLAMVFVVLALVVCLVVPRARGGAFYIPRLLPRGFTPSTRNPISLTLTLTLSPFEVRSCHLR